MRARMCDRCGEYYKKDNKFIDEFRLAKISQTASRYTKSIDLCPECQKSLTYWFEHYEKSQN